MTEAVPCRESRGRFLATVSPEADSNTRMHFDGFKQKPDCGIRRTVSTTPHILIVEDDREISTLVARYLRGNDCRVSIAGDGREMDRLMADSRVDLVVLDLMLPGEDGLSICRRLRAAPGLRIPILMLTAKSEEIDRIVGLEIGADDYLAKTFNPRELLARIRAILRRGAAAPGRDDEGVRRHAFGGFVLDAGLRQLLNPEGAAGRAHRRRVRPPARHVPAAGPGALPRPAPRPDAGARARPVRAQHRRAGESHPPERSSATRATPR